MALYGLEAVPEPRNGKAQHRVKQITERVHYPRVFCARRPPPRLLRDHLKVVVEHVRYDDIVRFEQHDSSRADEQQDSWPTPTASEDVN